MKEKLIPGDCPIAEFRKKRAQLERKQLDYLCIRPYMSINYINNGFGVYNRIYSFF